MFLLSIILSRELMVSRSILSNLYYSNQSRMVVIARDILRSCQSFVRNTIETSHVFESEIVNKNSKFQFLLF